MWSNKALDEYQCLENIKKLYRYDVRCDDQQQCIAIIEAAMVSTAALISDNSLISMIICVPVKKQGARISHHTIVKNVPFELFTELIFIENYCTVAV